MSSDPRSPTAMAASDRERRDLIFHWFVGEGRRWRVLLASLGVTLFLGGLMLVFQVVYPAPRQHHLVPQHITWLDASSPAARQVTNAVSDRDFLVLRDHPSQARTDLRLPMFMPGFKDFEFRVRDFLETKAAPASMPRIFRPDHPPLPAIQSAAAAPHVPKPPKPQTLQATVMSGLADRTITRPVIVAQPEAAGISFRVAVAADGRVTAAVPLGGDSSKPDLFKQLRPTLDKLRFEPLRDAAVQWGVIVFRWQEVAAP
jgi:hypothetical protein